MRIRKGFTYDDVLLVPKYSEIKTRKDVKLNTKLGPLNLEKPFISANMSSVTDGNMAVAVSKFGGLPILHRFHRTYEDMLAEWENIYHSINCRNFDKKIGLSIGVMPKDFELVNALPKHCDLLCIDVAHGHHDAVRKMIEHIKSKNENITVIAGNVATSQGALFLAQTGADIIKVGVGPGSLCSTRIETGNGVPQLTALEDVEIALEHANLDVGIIADGGIKNAGDIVKALCFADAVMLGSLLAGTSEAPGDMINFNGNSYKMYAGSSTHKFNHVEGVSGYVHYKGPVKNILEKLEQGVKSGLSYQGAKSIEEFKKMSHEFIEISNAGLTESKPHGNLL